MLSKISLRVLLRPKIAAPSMHQRHYSVDSISTKPSIDDISVKEKSVSDTSFATLLRNSTFVQMGNPIGKVSFWPMYWVWRLGYVLVNRFCYHLWIFIIAFPQWASTDSPPKKQSRELYNFENSLIKASYSITYLLWYNFRLLLEKYIM